MNYVILSQRVPPDNYRDELGALYNYPKRYWNRINTGDRFIYHQPRSTRGGGMVYLGCGSIGEISPDPADLTRRNAELVDYTQFTRPVPVVRRGRFLEPGISSQAQMIGNAVRLVDEETAKLILQRSRAAPPWTWEVVQEHEGSFSHASAGPQLIEALSRFDTKYASSKPEVRRRLLDSLHRPSSVSRIIKQLYGTTCAICGREGFPKRDGTKYAEVHHVEEISTKSLGVLGSQNMIVVCATCHRMLHYADVEVDPTASGWLITINGQQHRLKRLATEKGSNHLRIV